MQASIIKAQESDFKIIAELAKSIWQKHYVPIIGEEQVNASKFLTRTIDKCLVADFGTDVGKYGVGRVGATRVQLALQLTKWNLHSIRNHHGCAVGMEAPSQGTTYSTGRTRDHDCLSIHVHQPRL